MAKDVKPGDVVWVTWTWRGKPERYPVAKVGRTLAHIKNHGRTEAFRLDDGRINDRTGGASFQTQAEKDAGDRAAAAVKVLRDAGLEVRPGRRHPLALLESLAATVAEYQRLSESTEA